MVSCNSVNLFRVLFSPSITAIGLPLPITDAETETDDAPAPPVGALIELAASSDEILAVESARMRGIGEAIAGTSVRVGMSEREPGWKSAYNRQGRLE